MGNVLGIDNFGADMYSANAGGIYMPNAAKPKPRETITINYSQPTRIGEKCTIKFDSATGKYVLKLNGKLIGNYRTWSEASNMAEGISKYDGKYGRKPAAPEPVVHTNSGKVGLPEGYSPIARSKVNLNGIKPVNSQIVVPEPVVHTNSGKVGLPEGYSGIRRAPKINPEGIKYNPQTKVKGFWGKFTQFAKKNWKLGAALALVTGLGGLLFKGCSGDKKDMRFREDNQSVNPVTNPQESAGSTEVEQPVAAAQASEAAENSKYANFKAIPGSFEWRFAERELLLEHLGEANYKPSATEISQRAAEIAARDNRKIDNTGHSVDENGKMVQVGEDMILTEQMAQLANEARAQLIQEHKDQKDYEPSWAEIRKIVDKKIQDLQTEASQPAA